MKDGWSKTHSINHIFIIQTEEIAYFFVGIHYLKILG